MSQRRRPSNCRISPMSHNRYLPTDLSPDAALRLVCLPYAGGGTAVYYRWRPAMPPQRRIEVVPICLPGREARIAEPPLTTCACWCGDRRRGRAAAAIGRSRSLGHSMGAWLAFELARELRRRGERMPCLLVAAASPAPHRPRSAQSLHQLPDAEFVAEMSRRFDGIPPAVRENDELLQLLLPAMRADVELLETYEYSDEPPLDARHPGARRHRRSRRLGDGACRLASPHVGSVFESRCCPADTFSCSTAATAKSRTAGRGAGDRPTTRTTIWTPEPESNPLQLNWPEPTEFLRTFRGRNPRVGRAAGSESRVRDPNWKRCCRRTSASAPDGIVRDEPRRTFVAAARRCARSSAAIWRSPAAKWRSRPIRTASRGWRTERTRAICVSIWPTPAIWRSLR